MATSWAEDEFVMISALEHFSYCPRQCALIHIENVYDENLYTLRGNRAHARVHDEDESESLEGVRIERGMPLFSERLGLIGKSDVVEFGSSGVPFPVEYKVGPRKSSRHDEVQLCAQGLCLEEMFECAVPGGAIFHHSSRRRRNVAFGGELRRETEEMIAHVREMITTATVPAPVADARCPKCSLFDACMPFTLVQMNVERGLAELFDPER